MPIKIGYNLEFRCDYYADDLQCEKATVITRYNIDECVRTAKDYGWSITGDVGATGDERAYINCPLHSGHDAAQEED